VQQKKSSAFSLSFFLAAQREESLPLFSSFHSPLPFFKIISISIWLCVRSWVSPKVSIGSKIRRCGHSCGRLQKKKRKKKNKKIKIMSVAGIDFGSKSNVVALARRKGIDVVMNEESKRETPSLINFGDKCVSLSFFFLY